jgi:hypothetical protein
MKTCNLKSKECHGVIQGEYKEDLCTHHKILNNKITIRTINGTVHQKLQKFVGCCIKKR